MANNDRDGFGAFLSGFIIGGLIGAVVALLFAPQSGEETRTMIKEKSIELKDKAVEAGQEARAKAEQALEEARLKAQEALEDLRTRADELTSVARERAKELQTRGQVVIEEQKAKIETKLGGKKKAGGAPGQEPPAGSEAPTA